MEKALEQNIVPKTVQSRPCDSFAIQAQIIYGGQWIVILHGDGTLHLRKPDSDTPSAVDDTFREIVDDIGPNDGLKMSLSLSDTLEPLLCLTIFCSWDAL